MPSSHQPPDNCSEQHHAHGDDCPPSHAVHVHQLSPVLRGEGPSHSEIDRQPGNGEGTNPDHRRAA